MCGGGGVRCGHLSVGGIRWSCGCSDGGVWCGGWRCVCGDGGVRCTHSDASIRWSCGCSDDGVWWTGSGVSVWTDLSNVYPV